jgi:hypothetical protein
MNKSFDDSGAVTDGRVKHIVLVGGDDQNFRSFLGLNAEFTVIQIAGAVGSNQRQAAHRIYEVDDFDYSTLSKIIRQVHDLKWIDYLYSFFEASLLPSAILAQELGVRGLDSLSCDLSINKSKLREHLAGSEFEVPHQPCETAADAISLMKRCATDIVLKDQAGFLSENVFICTNPSEVETAFRTIRDNGVERILAEQRLVGKEYSVESLSIDGVHTVMGITEKYPYRDKLFEKCQVFPAPSMSAQTRGQVDDFIRRLLDKIQHRHGPTHIEIMLSDKGPHVVEINNRIGGDLIWLLVESVTGVDMLRETIRSIVDPGAGVLSTAARGGRHRIAACRALLGKFDVDAFVKMLPPNIALLTTSYWTDYPLGKVIEKASDRFGYIAVGFDSMSAFDAMFETFDHMVSRAESGHPQTQLSRH